MEQQQPVLEMRGIHKQFPGVKALSNVDFRLFAGEVHALMGENGAGKSTLIKVLTGVYSIDQGNVNLAGQPVSLKSPLEAQAAGISTVYQEVNLCTNLTVAENIFIGREPRRLGGIHWKEMNRGAAKLLKERMQLDIDVTLPLNAYSVAIQQLIAIARALNISAKVLILDEPTSSLDANEVKQLFTIIRKLKQEGLAILFVTHFLDQVYEVSDRITILRNGNLIGEYMAKDLPKLELVSQMIGKDLTQLEKLPAKSTSGQFTDSKVIAEAKQAARTGVIEPFDLNIRQGEVVGLAGLLGSGRTEAARLFFGADPLDKGSVRISGAKEGIHSPRKAIEQGVAYCSENRKTEGILDDLTVRENIIVALQSTRGWHKPLSRKKQNEIADHFIKLLNINPPHAEHLIKNLSGGNQQKVLLARWLLTEPKLLILDEPTRGIDVGAKTEIQRLVLDLSRKGMSVLFISSELEEVLRVSHRVAVLRDRRKIKELSDQEMTEHYIMNTIAGG